MLLDAEGSKYFLFLDDGARFDGDEPPGCKVARPASARFSRHLGLMGGKGCYRQVLVYPWDPNGAAVRASLAHDRQNGNAWAGQ